LASYGKANDKVDNIKGLFDKELSFGKKEFCELKRKWNIRCFIADRTKKKPTQAKILGG